MICRIVLLPVLLCTFLLGCKNTPIKPGEVKANWSRNLHQLGIVPVFPPREDVYVGDVYSYEVDPENDKYIKQLFKDYDELTQDEQIELIPLGMGSRLARLDLNDLISLEYSTTLSAPQTSSDYNSIIENPSIAAIDDKIGNQKDKITEIEDEIVILNKEKTDATERLKIATRTKEDTDTEVTKLLAELNLAKSKPPTPGDSSQIDSQISQEKLTKRQKEDELAKIKHEITLAEIDSNEHKKLQNKEKVATYELEIIKTNINRLQEDKAAISSTPYDFSNEDTLYNESVKKQITAQKELTGAIRDNTDITERNTSKITTKTASLTSEKAKLTELNDLKKAIVTVGAKSLFKQPNAAKKNIYKWGDIDSNNDLSRLNRLKLVAFPEFTSTMSTQKDLSALIPAEALAFNISSSAVETVSIKIPSAESYGISFKNLAKSIFKNDGSGGLAFNDNFLDLITAAKWRASMLEEGQINSSDKFYLRIITEVFYARAFDISLFSNNSFGAVVDYAKLPEPKNDEDNSQGENPQKDYSQFSGVIDSSSPGNSNDLLSQLKSNLSRIQNVPGGTVQTLNYSDSSIGLRRVFDRPIAVGYRGFTLEIYPCYSKDDNGNCVIKIGKLTTATSPVPLAPMN